MKLLRTGLITLAALAVLAGPARADADSISILRQGVLGAGVGAISSYASGGKAGRGALIGAGVQVIGNALLGILTGGQAQQPSYAPQPVYSQPASAVTYQAPVQVQPVYQPQPVRVQTIYQYEPQPVIVQQPQPVYYTSYAPREDSNRRILRNGALGAGVGAISAYASGGKAGQGALVGAGTNVLGDALLGILTN